MGLNKSSYKKRAFSTLLAVILLTSCLMTPLLFYVQAANAASPPVLGTLKWSAQIPGGGEGVVIGDLENNGIQDIVWAGSNRCVAIRGTDGSTLWNVSVPGAYNSTQPQIADLRNNGHLEVIVPILGEPSGFYILNGTTGLSEQNITTIKKASGTTFFYDMCQNGPVIAPVSPGDYPTIFFATMATVQNEDGSNSSGYLVSYKYSPTAPLATPYVQQNYTQIWHPCSGGLSAADCENNGQLELFMCDRNMYYDRGYGQGVESFWGSNLTERWSDPDLLVSSNKPILADVDGTGKLEVVVTTLTGGIVVLNANDGSVDTTGGIYRKNLNVVTQWGNVSGHYQSSVCDLLGNGHQDLLMSDGYGYLDFGYDRTLDTVVWDLTSWQEIARISGNLTGRCYYGPQEGDVTGDGIMDIVLCNNSVVMAFDGSHNPATDHTYPLLWMSQNLTGRLMYPVITDVDGDGYNEIIVPSQGGWLYCFSTPAPAINPPARTEVQFNSERRLGTDQYIPPPFATLQPIVNSPSPASWTQYVPITTSQLSFSLTSYQNTSMSYSVTTSPNIGGGSGNGVSNGRYAVSVSSLQYSTLYTWNVDVSAGAYWTNDTYWFTTASAPYSDTAPTQGTPTLSSSSGTNSVNDNFTAYNQSTADANGNSVSNIYHWYQNGVSTMNLLYSFDTNNATNVEDYSGYGNNGQIFYNVAWTPNGLVGGAYNFNGGYIVVPESATLDGNYSWYAMSAEVWVKFTTDQEGVRVLFKQPSYEIGFSDSSANTVYAGVWVLKPNPNQSPGNGGWVADYLRATDPTPLSKNAWHQVAFTYKYGQGVSLYVDGAVVANTNNSATDIGNVQRGTQPLYIGRFDYYHGMIDEVSIYSTCLSSQQIYQDYIQTKKGQSSSSTLVSAQVKSGDQLVCTVTPNDGYMDGTPKSTSPITVGVSPAVGLTVSTVGSGSVALNNTGPYNYGDVVQLTAVPSSGWSFAGWSGNLTGSTNPANLIMTGNLSVTATFTNVSSVTLTVSSVGGGSVKLNNTGPYNYGDVVQLNATPALGWTFDHWSGNLTGSTNPATLAMNGNASVTATFVQLNYTLNVTVSPVGSGNVSLNNTGPYYHYGDVVLFTAVPAVGWNFSSWGGSLSGSALSATLTVTGNLFVTATFTNTSSTIIFSDGFESGGFVNWTGTSHSSGGAAAAVSSPVNSGSYSAMFTTPGLLGYETSYAYENIPSSAELYTRGYVDVNHSGITANSGYFDFIIFEAGSNILAYAGWKMTGGVVKWALMIRSGTGYTGTAYSTSAPSLNTWYSVELHWKNDAVSGYAELYVNGALVCSITGKNTSAFGNANTVRFGLAETYNCTSNVVYCDDAVISNNYIGPLSQSPNTYTLSDSVSPIGGGSVTLNNTGPYNLGDVVLLTAVPNSGWIFDHWSGNLTGSTNPATLVMNGNASVTATFVQLNYTLNVTIVGGGSVSLNNTGPYYHYGDVVLLTAVPAVGWNFSSWSGSLSGSALSATLTVTGNSSVTATFTNVPPPLNIYTLNVSSVGGGSVKLNNTGPYNYGDVVQLNATPNSGWIFDHWSGNLTGSTNPATLKMNGNASVTATFYMFSDGFESGSFSAWTGTSHSAGGTSAVVSTVSNSGNYSAMFTTTGSTGYGTSFVYENITSSPELYALSYFDVTQNGITANTGYLYLIIFKAGSNNLAYAGLKMTGGVVYWSLLIRSGTGYTSSAYSAAPPSLNTWYSVELHWKNDPVSGYAELYVNGQLVCSITGKNTSAFGNADSVRLGIAEYYNCTNSVVYCDDAAISNIYIGPLSPSAQSQISMSPLTNVTSDAAQTITTYADQKFVKMQDVHAQSSLLVRTKNPLISV